MPCICIGHQLPDLNSSLSSFTAAQEVVSARTKIKKEITAIDKGGPTKALVSAFCLQLRDLCIHVAIMDDEKIMDPPKFSRVRIGSATLGIIAPGIIVATPSNNDNMYTIQVGEEKIRLSRDQFTVHEIAFSLFDCIASSYLVPSRDFLFESNFERFVENRSEYDLDYLLEKAKVYYRAVGRFMAHVIFDGNLTLSNIVLPELLRNFLLRGVTPIACDSIYPLPELLSDLHDIDHLFSVAKNNNSKGGKNTMSELVAQLHESGDLSSSQNEAITSGNQTCMNTFKAYTLDDDL